MRGLSKCVLIHSLALLPIDDSAQAMIELE